MELTHQFSRIAIQVLPGEEESPLPLDDPYDDHDHSGGGQEANQALHLGIKQFEEVSEIEIDSNSIHDSDYFAPIMQKQEPQDVAKWNIFAKSLVKRINHPAVKFIEPGNRRFPYGAIEFDGLGV